jgi:pyruvate ferredoxin oxidoreductase gamma subunit
LRAFNRVSDKELRTHCPVKNPGVVVVVDATLLDAIDVTEGALDNAAIIVNTTKEPKEIREKIKAKPTQRVITVDASKIAVETIGRQMPNSPMIGTVTMATKLLPIESVLEDVKKSFGKKFSQKIIDGNLEAVKRGYTEVKEG